MEANVPKAHCLRKVLIKGFMKIMVVTICHLLPLPLMHGLTTMFQPYLDQNVVKVNKFVFQDKLRKFQFDQLRMVSDFLSLLSHL